MISVERHDWDQWLSGSNEHAWALIQIPRMDVIAHAPVDPKITEGLPA